MDPNNSMCFWKETWTSAIQRSPFLELEALFSLSKKQQFPNADGLNELLGGQPKKPEISFICQSELDEKTREVEENQYYELVIAQQKIVPTRPNSWHDLFNGLVWLQYPETKRLLNQWHVEDIEEFGLSPRTTRRNNLTHFDECGVVLAVCETDQHLVNLLAQHQWHEAFVVNRHKWADKMEAFIFGHANYEMLLEPFIGLTGKWLAVRVEQDFIHLPLCEKRLLLDQKMAKQLVQSNIMDQRRPLKPLPLLGIPHWHSANTKPEFYQNTDYFRPLNRILNPKSEPETIL